MGETCGENLAKNSADFRPSISRKAGRKKFHEKLAANSTSRETNFFHRETLGGWGLRDLKSLAIWRTEIAAIFAICDCDAHRGPKKSLRVWRQDKAMLHCRNAI